MVIYIIWGVYSFKGYPYGFFSCYLFNYSFDYFVLFVIWAIEL